MKKLLLAIVLVASLPPMTTPSVAGRMTADPLRAAFQSLHAARPMSAVKQRQRLVEDAQCAGQLKPLIACTCVAQDAYGACLQETCDTVCDGKDGDNG